MKKEQIALQLYTLREHCGTTAEFAQTCRRVMDIGYRAVEVAGVDRSRVADAEIRSICDDHGLAICSAHDTPGVLLDETGRSVEFAQSLRTGDLVYPFPAGFDLGRPTDVDRLVDQLAEASRTLAQAGISLSYHHHHHEFRNLDGKTVLDSLLERLQPDILKAELDTYWVQYGGGNPAAWCARCSGRMSHIHLKDYGINADHEPTFQPVGEGNLDMPAILDAAAKAGCQWFIVEQDRCEGDAFEAVAASHRYLAGLAD